MPIQSSFRRGFTLIELMIVIVILGVLMGTILPRLTGAQARARDTGRIADLNTLSQALETYFDDNGDYPGTMGSVYCLMTGTMDTAPAGTPGTAGTVDATTNSIGGYLKGGTVPRPPSSAQVTAVGGRHCVGSYLYAPLRNLGLDNNGYLLASDVETYQNANYSTVAIPTASPAFTPAPSISATTEVSAYDTLEGNTLATVDSSSDSGSGALATIYIIAN